MLSRSVALSVPLTRKASQLQIANGANQGGGTLMNLRNYTMSLPRDLSVTSGGLLRQRFIPELQKLRIASSHVHVGEQPLASGGIPKAAFVKGAAGRQLEIRARFRVGASALVAQRKFGLAVLASPSMAEYTSITLDPAREHVLLDRRQSGVSVDSDVRGGPWPGAAAAGEILLHVYVDQAVVELIATGSATTGTKVDGAPIIESTAVAAWVQPTSQASDGVALWSEAEGTELVSLDVWQLESPTHGKHALKSDDAQQPYTSFHPGQEWHDTDGQPIRAHSAGLLPSLGGESFWLYGADNYTSGTYKRCRCFLD